MKAGEGNQEGRIQETNISSEGVIDNPPGKRQDGLLHALAQVLGVLDQGPVGLEHDQAAVHVLQEVELALQDGVGTVREVETILKSVIELVLDDCGAGVDESGVGDDAKLFNFTGQKHTGWGQEQRIHRV